MEKSNQWSTELFSGSCIYLLVCFFKLQIINLFFTACFLVNHVSAEHKLLLFTPLQSLTGFSLRASGQQLVGSLLVVVTTTTKQKDFTSVPLIMTLQAGSGSCAFRLYKVLV